MDKETPGPGSYDIKRNLAGKEYVFGLKTQPRETDETPGP